MRRFQGSSVIEAENEEADIMRRRPRNLLKPLFDRRTVVLSLLQGIGVFLAVLAVFVMSMKMGYDEKYARGLGFTALIIANLGLILTNRSWSRTILKTLRSPNAALWWVLGGALLFLGLSLYVPFLRGLFLFGTMRVSGLAVSFAAGLISVLWFEGFKTISKKSSS